MANFNSKRCHIAFMDSRGMDLQGEVNKINRGEYLEVRVYKGATLHQLAKMASKHLNSYPFDVVYVAGGTCNITDKDSVTSKISFNWKKQEDLQTHIMKEVEGVYDFLAKSHPASRVVVCPIVGIDLGRVVNEHEVDLNHQEWVDTTVFEVNTELFHINKIKKVFSPPLHRTIHRSVGGIRKSHYHHLADGVHLSDEQRESWARWFVAATGKN